MNKLRILHSCILSLTTFISVNSFATQHVTKAEQQTVNVAVSNAETNVLVVDGRKIQSIVLSEIEALETQKDTVQGVLYFKISPNYINRSITAFVTDDENVRYSVVLQPRSINSEEIILIPPKEDTKGGVNGLRNTGSFIQQVKELIYTMGDDAEDNKNELAVDGISKTLINVEIPLWKEARLTLLRRYDSENMYGELYQITNATSGNLNLLEQEFYRKGVVAVSVQNLTLPPNKSTFVYVVREQ